MLRTMWYKKFQIINFKFHIPAGISGIVSRGSTPKTGCVHAPEANFSPKITRGRNFALHLKEIPFVDCTSPYRIHLGARLQRCSVFFLPPTSPIGKWKPDWSASRWRKSVPHPKNRWPSTADLGRNSHRCARAPTLVADLRKFGGQNVELRALFFSFVSPMFSMLMYQSHFFQNPHFKLDRVSFFRIRSNQNGTTNRPST